MKVVEPDIINESVFSTIGYLESNKSVIPPIKMINKFQKSSERIKKETHQMGKKSKSHVILNKSKKGIIRFIE